MSEKLLQTIKNIERIKQPNENELAAIDIARIGIKLARMAIELSYVERIPRYNPESRENDVEHSFMLSFIAQEVVHKYFPELDMALVLGFCIVHDLPERKTSDTGTFKISQEELDDKYKNDRKAAKETCEESPPYTAWLLGEYEKQQKPEARFVRLLDKLMPPIVDIVGEGTQVMHEDHGVYTLDDLAEAEDELILRFKTMFPEKELEVLHATKKYLSEEFRKVFRPRSPILSEFNYAGSFVEV